MALAFRVSTLSPRYPSEFMCRHYPGSVIMILVAAIRRLASQSSVANVDERVGHNQDKSRPRLAPALPVPATAHKYVHVIHRCAFIAVNFFEWAFRLFFFYYGSFPRPDVQLNVCCCMRYLVWGVRWARQRRLRVSTFTGRMTAVDQFQC